MYLLMPFFTDVPTFSLLVFPNCTFCLNVFHCVSKVYSTLCRHVFANCTLCFHMSHCV